MAPHAHMNGHTSSVLPLHGHTTHMHRCNHHGHLHRHSHGHGHDHMYNCNCDCDNGNASLTTSALASPHPPMGTLVAARHACACNLCRSSCHSHDASPCPLSGTPHGSQAYCAHPLSCSHNRHLGVCALPLPLP